MFLALLAACFVFVHVLARDAETSAAPAPDERLRDAA
jgi:hypothetical protein